MDVKQTKYSIKHLPLRHSIMLTGPHGIGKSEMWAQCAAEMSTTTGHTYELVDIRLSEREAGDIIGYPRGVSEHKATKSVYEKGKLVDQQVILRDVMLHSLPSWFPQDPQSHGYLLLDELDRATREVQQAAMELALDGGLNQVRLPAGWRVGTCCNGNPDIYTTLIPCPALMSRFVKIPFQPTVPEWMARYETVDGHPSISQYIGKIPADLFCPEGALEPYKVYPNPRSWVKLSEAIKSLGAEGEDPLRNLDYLMLLASGYIGEATAVSFVDFIRKDYKIHTPEEILDGLTPEMLKEFAKSPVTDITWYSNELVKFISKNGLTKKRQANLTKFFTAIPKEAASGFYRYFLETDRDHCTEWYTNDAKISTYILDDLLAKEKA